MEKFLGRMGRLGIVVVLLLQLLACGGDGDGESSYQIGGTVSGLSGDGLVLRNNGVDDLTIDADGGFAFSAKLDDGAAYNVTITTQPAGQSCTIANGSGVLAGADVINISITCGVASYHVGGSVAGLVGGGLVLQNNGSDDLAIESNGSFSFPTRLEHGSAYAVTIAAQPSGRSCTVNNGSGTLAGADVTHVLISCPPDAVTPTVSAAGPKLLRFTWNDVGADHYELLKNPDGNSGYSQVGGNITTTTVDEEIAVHLTDWVNASYLVQACNAADDCTDSEPMTITSQMLGVTGYLKEPHINGNVGFGNSVALSGDGMTLAIGAPFGRSLATGTVYVFVRDGDGWAEQAKIKASNAGGNDRFGAVVSLSEDGLTLAVGAENEDSAATEIDGNQEDNTQPDAGAAYIFSRTGSVWSQEAYIKASDAAEGNGFGKQVSLSGNGDRLAVSGGGVYLFERDRTGWVQQAILEASNGETGDDFGAALKLSADGGTLAVSAPLEDSAATGIDGDQANNSSIDSGAVYVFTFEGSAWTQQAYIKASNNDSDDIFGEDLTISADGNTLAVGALGEDSFAKGVDGDPVDNSSENSGAVYLFERQDNLWAQNAYFKASNAEAYDGFGFRVVVSGDGDSLAISALGEASIARGVNGDQADNSALLGLSYPGAVYLFTRRDLVWSQKAYVKASNTDTGYPFEIAPPTLFVNDSFGGSLALSSDGATLVVGAPGENSGDPVNQEDDSAPGSGAAYLY